MMNSIHPLVTVGGRALQRAGYRITSVIRPAGRPDGHRSGRVLDIAKWHYSLDYSPSDVAHVAQILESTTNHPWLVVAEDNHIHAELSPSSRRGYKNRHTNNQLIYEQGDPMYNRSHQLARAARKLGLSSETGDPIPSSFGNPNTEIPDQRVQEVALALQSPMSPESQALVTVAKQQDPQLFDKASSVAAIRMAIAKDIRYIDYTNAKEISSSIGNGAPLRQADVTAVANLLSVGLPAFEPQVFNFTNINATEWAFWPAFALSQSQGGPLLNTELFDYIGQLIELTVPVLTAQVGLPVTCRVEYGPSAMTKNFMESTFYLGSGNEPVKISMLNGAQTGGLTRLQKRTLAVTAGVPVLGLSYPVVRLFNLPVASGYNPVVRFFQPGDRSVDRFMGLLGNG